MTGNEEDVRPFLEALVEKEEAAHLLWFYGHTGGLQPGGFKAALLTVWSKADTFNQLRLGLAFPATERAVLLAREPFGIAALQRIVRGQARCCDEARDCEVHGDTICEVHHADEFIDCDAGPHCEEVTPAECWSCSANALHDYFEQAHEDRVRGL